VAARSKARKRALDVLFEAELRGLPVLGLLADTIVRTLERYLLVWRRGFQGA